MLEDACFWDKVRTIRSTARAPGQKACIDAMCDVKKKMVAKLSAMLMGEHVCITVDDCASCTSDTYMSLTISLIASA